MKITLITAVVSGHLDNVICIPCWNQGCESRKQESPAQTSATDSCRSSWTLYGPIAKKQMVKMRTACGLDRPRGWSLCIELIARRLVADPAVVPLLLATL
jgi:hypothetical protein